MIPPSECQGCRCELDGPEGLPMQMPVAQSKTRIRSTVTSSMPFHRKTAPRPPPVAPTIPSATMSRMIHSFVPMQSIPPM